MILHSRSSRPHALLGAIALLFVFAPACTPTSDVGDHPSSLEDAASDATHVAPGEAVTFRMRVTSDAGAAYALSSVSDPGDARWWYSVARDDGTPLQIFLRGLAVRCDDCAAVTYPVGFACNEVPAAGVSATWNGIAYGALARCTSSDGSDLGCLPPSRVPPGRYRVTMCTQRLGNCESSNPSDQVCVTVPFDYPSSTEVVGTVSL